MNATKAHFSSPLFSIHPFKLSRFFSNFRTSAKLRERLQVENWSDMHTRKPYQVYINKLFTCVLFDNSKLACQPQKESVRSPVI
jgi:hypothetical protein